MKIIDKMFNKMQLYSYLLPTIKIGNWIQDFRSKYIISKL